MTRIAADGKTPEEYAVVSRLFDSPANWPKKNMQVLLHPTVYKGTPAAPRVLATHFW